MRTHTAHRHTNANHRHAARTFIAAIETAAQFICFPLGTPTTHHSAH